MVKLIVRAVEGRDLFSSYVTLGTILFVCSIYTLWWFIEAAKLKGPGRIDKTANLGQTSSADGGPRADDNAPLV